MQTNSPGRAGGKFLYYSGIYCDINGLGENWEDFFSEQIGKINDSSIREQFQREFASAILGSGASSTEYERATGWDFDTEDEYREHLRALWTVLYGDLRPEDAV